MLVLLNRHSGGKWYSVVLKSRTERGERNVICRNSKMQKEQLDAGSWRRLKGEVIRISAISDTHLNALNMDSAYGDDKNPLIEKLEFILSLFE